VALALVACSDSKTQTQTQTASAAATACTPIVVDPGHNSRANPATEPIGPGSRVRKIKDGGGTSGVATHTPESVVNLQIALRLRKLLQADGYCVTMTRTRQTGVSMGNIARARIANRGSSASMPTETRAPPSTAHRCSTPRSTAAGRTTSCPPRASQP
jgi:N-acetylmuramoyl-L-alanine amidase